ncbi:hypothetical protein DFJ73DRAFT_902798 [Zopfochytrium polystomum]|nr:hypothetical protein DFJ73DRAFT_902798 [Zopfochytrium polystomum]
MTSTTATSESSETPVIVVAGYGPGISRTVALRLAKDKGLAVALLARTESRLRDAEKEFAAEGITAMGFPVDFGDVDATRRAIESVRTMLGPIHILFWNVASTTHATLLLDPSSISALSFSFASNVGSLVSAVQASLPDLTSARGAVLVTGGGMELDAVERAQSAVAWRFSSLAPMLAAKRKTVQVLHEELRAVGVYAGSVTVMGPVKGTGFDDGSGRAKIELSAVADKFAALLEARAGAFDSVA